MKKLLLTLLISLAAGSLSGCRVPECVREGLTPNRLYIVSYDNPPTTRRDILQTADANGRLTFPPDANGGCSAVTVSPAGVGFLNFSASPDSIDLNSPPATMTISGSGISSQYYMPRVEFYDNNSNFVGSVTAVWVASDGSSLVAYTPDLSSVYSGTYQLAIVNINEGETRELIGVTNVDAYGRDDTSCNPTAQEIADCENCCGVQTYWDYSSCRCWIP
jgi:hypothetical protein